MKELVGYIYRKDNGEEIIEYEEKKKILWIFSQYDSNNIHNHIKFKTKMECPNCHHYYCSDCTIENLKEKCLYDNSPHFYCGYCGHKNIVNE